MSVRRALDRHYNGRTALRPEPPAQKGTHPMPNYMLLLHQDSTRPRPTSPDEIMAITKSYMNWADRMRAEGRLKGGEKLTFDAGKVMRPKNGKVTVTDGPYAESKELVGG